MNNSSQRVNPLTGKKITRNMYLTKKRKNLLEKSKNGETSLEEERKVEDLIKIYNMSKQTLPIEEQFKDVSRATGKGVLKYSHSGLQYYSALKILIVGSSGSGKSTNVLNLLLESPNSFRAVHLIAPDSTKTNETYTTLQYYLQKAGIEFFFTDSDKVDEDYTFGDARKKDKEGSSKYLTNMKPAFIIFDDILRSNSKTNPVYNLMIDSSVKWRHLMKNSVYCLQSPAYIPSAISLNFSHLFISGNFLSREGVWDRLKLAEPTNLQEMIEFYNTLADKRHAFFYIKQDDSYLHYYQPYEFHNRQQIVRKFQMKLPKGDFTELDKQKDESESESEDIDVVDDATYKKKAADKINKAKVTFSGEKIKEEGKRIDKVITDKQSEKKKKKYVLYNNIKYYL